MVGEIGYDEDKFLYHLVFWKIQSIIRGYRRRTRESWMQCRWQTWVIGRMLGSTIESPQDMLPLPFDHQQRTEEEIKKDDEQLEQLIAECQEYNRKIKSNQ